MSTLIEDIKRAEKLLEEMSGPPASSGLLSGGVGPDAMRFFADDPYSNFGAMRIFQVSSMVEQFRFPRSKRKRIRNKWRKRSSNFRPSRHALVNQRRGHIYCHPTTYEEIKRQIPRAR